MDTLHTFIEDCKARDVDYVDAFLTGNTTAEGYEKVWLDCGCSNGWVSEISL
jgi:hypothetical protein